MTYTPRTMAEWVAIDRRNGEGAFYDHNCKACRNRSCDPITRDAHAQAFVAKWNSKHGKRVFV